MRLRHVRPAPPEGARIPLYRRFPVKPGLLDKRSIDERVNDHKVPSSPSFGWDTKGNLSFN
jgi:hypothetical protein